MSLSRKYPFDFNSWLASLRVLQLTFTHFIYWSLPPQKSLPSGIGCMLMMRLYEVPSGSSSPFGMLSLLIGLSPCAVYESIGESRVRSSHWPTFFVGFFAFAASFR